jgi:hypothetical protein
MTKVFISYVREDSSLVNRLANDLEKGGVDIWLDRKCLKPGYRWADAIRDGISQGDFFIACFSEYYVRREKTYMNEELTLAIEELRMRPVDQAWFIPVRLSACQIPSRNIGAGETLSSIQRVDLFDDWDNGIRQILSVIDLKRQSDFFFAAQKVWGKEINLLKETAADRNKYWDKFSHTVEAMENSPEKYRIQKRATKKKLKKFGLSIFQLKEQLKAIRLYEGTINNQFTDDLVDVITAFQRIYNLRHHDGIFGELTYLELERVTKHSSK